VERVGQRHRYGGQPQQKDGLDDARQTGCGVGSERMADGHIPLDGERGDGEHGRGGC